MSDRPSRLSRASRPSAVDAELLATLERAFSRIAGANARIDASVLQRALGIRSEYLARRVLTGFDTDGDGTVSKDEFLDGVRALMFGTDRERLRFAFRLHDHDGDGGIDLEELRRMIAITLAEDDIVTTDDVGDDLARDMFRVGDRNASGRISFDEFEALLEGRPDLLSRMTRHEAMWIAPNEDVLARLDGSKRGGQASHRARLRRLLENRWVEVAFVTVWAAVNGVLFLTGLLGEAPAPATPWKHLSNAFTTPIAFNAVLILVPVLRRLLTWVRKTPALRRVPIDDGVTFHRMVGHVLFALVMGHGISELVAIGSAPAAVARLVQADALTGIAWLTVFAVIWFFSLAWIRKTSHFELFYFTHWLYVAWFALAIFHAGSVFLAAAGGILGLIVEHMIRRRKRARKTSIVEKAALRSAVTRLEIARPPGFVFSAGDYLFLRIPAIARHEWHPFTISSAPEVPALTVHIRTLGNWTAALRRRVEEDEATGSTEPLVAHVDGPYGSPSRHILDAKCAVLIGAGIGVTPFASILESILLRAKSGAGTTLEKVHFIWLNRDAYSFEWFAALLADLESHDDKRLFDVHAYMTGGRAGASAMGLEIARLVRRERGKGDLVTGLQATTHMGHPDFRAILTDIARQHASGIDVFFCGPLGLGKKVSAICGELGLRYREERF